MNDMSQVIIPKSDQLNSDDLIAGPRTIKITSVDIRPGTEQPVSIFYEGDNGKPWKSCKSMARVLVTAWGPDAKAYVGRSVTLYRDPTIKWGGMEVGGIRISHMSHLDGPLTLALTMTKGSRKPFVVRPLKVEDAVPESTVSATEKWANKQGAALKAMTTDDEFVTWIAKNGGLLEKMKAQDPGVYEILNDIVVATRAKLMGVEG